MKLDTAICTMLVEDIAHHEQHIRSAASAALAAVLARNTENLDIVIDLLLALYAERLYVGGRKLIDIINSQTRI